MSILTIKEIFKLGKEKRIELLRELSDEQVVALRDAANLAILTANDNYFEYRELFHHYIVEQRCAEALFKLCMDRLHHQGAFTSANQGFWVECEVKNEKS